jgi:ubiquitin carboxyl-terminal hydrolase L5
MPGDNSLTVHRKMDVLNADLALQNDYEKWVKANKTPKKKIATKKASKKKKEKRRRRKDEDEAGYHFVAYVPINGSVWRLDGLQRQPVNLGKITRPLAVIFLPSIRRTRRRLGLTG